MRWLGALPAALLLLGCDAAKPPEAEPALPPVEVSTGTSACEARTFEGSRFTVCPFDNRRQGLELVQIPGVRSLASLQDQLGARAQSVLFAMNAGMYDEEGRPIGLFVADGVEKKPLNLRSGSGNFHLLPNGVFAVDRAGRVFVSTGKAFRKQVPNPQWATQSGPMLVIDGKLHPKFDENGQSQLIRNGVGVADERTAFFVISEEPVSFGRFARLFRDALGCRNALYLDGSVSSLWDAPAGRQDAYAQLGPFAVIFSRRAGE